VASERNAGIIVMGLHSSPLLGPRMGSVTYQVLRRAGRLVLALPPVVHDAEDATASPPQESVASSCSTIAASLRKRAAPWSTSG
jgi:hypothetical protein